MANTNATYQQVNTVSVRREKLIDIASDTGYSKNDLRVFLTLLTQLEGFTPPKNNSPYIIKENSSMEKNRDMEFYTVMLKASSFRPNLRTIP